jgi:hypothetical protein
VGVGFERRIFARRGQPEAGVEVGAGRIRVDEDDGLAELCEVHGEVLRDERLTHPTATAAHDDEPARSAERLGRFRRIGGVGGVRRERGGHAKRGR